MSASSVTSPSSQATKLTYSVLVEEGKEGGYKATVWGLPECEAAGATREEAMENVRRLVEARLERAEIVYLEMELPKPEHPWMKFAGMFKDDPYFDEMLEDIKALRRERDAEMEASYRKLDAEEQAK